MEIIPKDLECLANTLTFMKKALNEAKVDAFALEVADKLLPTVERLNIVAKRQIDQIICSAARFHHSYVSEGGVLISGVSYNYRKNLLDKFIGIKFDELSNAYQTEQFCLEFKKIVVKVRAKVLLLPLKKNQSLCEKLCSFFHLN